MDSLHQLALFVSAYVSTPLQSTACAALSLLTMPTLKGGALKGWREDFSEDIMDRLQN